MLIDSIRFQNYLSEFRKSVASDLLLYIAVMIYAIVAFSYAASMDALNIETLLVYVNQWLLRFGLVFPFVLLTVGYIIVTMRFERRRSLAYRLMYNPKRVGRFFAGMLFFVALIVFITAFTTVKNTVPLESGFLYDVALADFDKALHFGVDPWQWLYALGTNEYVLRLVETNYSSFWLGINYSILFWVIISPRANKIRTRYVISYMLTWVILGNLIAIWFSSGGPVYYGAITGDVSRFSEQLAFLATSTEKLNGAVGYQNYLWELYETGEAGFGSGISAFPSVHVGFSAINALFIYEYSRKWGMYAFAYLGVILVSSVYLAWHYAIDGYASIIVVLAIYFAVKKIMSSSWVRTSQPGGVLTNS
ncbi:MAG: phosphatase PAP2 family protein [Rhizobiaceae bacterium]|nr:phosphatase PAP2 family protein [Rhizobiaceae bacterium]